MDSTAVRPGRLKNKGRYMLASSLKRGELPHLLASLLPSIPRNTANMGVPKEQQAAVRQGAGHDATAPVKSIPVSEPGPGQILVKVNWTGLCASDKSLLHDEWAAFGVAMMDATKGIAGHEGAGIVVAAHPDISHIWKEGDRAGIKWVASVCRDCEFCNNGKDELQCPKQLNSGFSTDGTFQEYVVTDGRYATRIPEGVLDEEAGPIM